LHTSGSLSSIDLMKTRLGDLGSRIARPQAAERGVGRLAILRWTLVACQAATIMISWRLWQARGEPPTLPAVPIPSLDLAIPLLLSLLVVLRYPLSGAIVHAVLLALSFGMDQTRLQPEVVSMALLLFATTGRRALVIIGRTHLITLWFWAGLAKLLSDNFRESQGGWMFDGLPLPTSLDGLGVYFGAVVIALEMGAGILAVPVRTRRWSAVLALGVHFGALVTLGPLGHNWNPVIWPWNVALPVAAFTLIAPWKESVRTELTTAGWPARVAVAFLVLFPAGYYIGAADAYLSHHLYSDDTPAGFVCNERGRCSRALLREPLSTVRVPLPPEHRLLRALFDETCEPGQILVIRDPRRWYASRDWQGQRRCPAERD
jgi:hypothetical protein